MSERFESKTPAGPGDIAIEPRALAMPEIPHLLLAERSDHRQ
jgi:hypothetical protein